MLAVEKTAMRHRIAPPSGMDGRQRFITNKIYHLTVEQRDLSFFQQISQESIQLFIESFQQFVIEQQGLLIVHY